MRKLKFDEHQIALILRQPGEGTTVEEVCRSAGIARQTYYRWRTRFGAMTPTEIQRLRELERENVQLRKLVAYLSLGHELNDLLRRGSQTSIKASAALSTSSSFFNRREFSR